MLWQRNQAANRSPVVRNLPKRARKAANNKNQNDF